MTSTVDAVLEGLVAGDASSAAIEDDAGIWTRGELRDAVDRARVFFERSGVESGDRVAVVTGADKHVVAALLGARAADALTCPIDPREAAADIACLRPRVAVGLSPSGDLPIVDVRRLTEGPAPRPRWPAITATERASGCAWGVRTSGSTGHKKTVLLTNASVAHVTHAVQEIVGYRTTDRIHGGLPLHHTYGLSQLWLAMISGACLFLPGGQPTEKALSRWIGGATVLPTISSKLRLLLDVGYRPDVRLITLAGQGTDAETRKRFAAAAGGARFVSFYGLTEATTRVLWADHDEFFGDARTTGRPIPGVRAWVDREGELWVDGPNVAAGYLDDAEGTRIRFPDGKLRTGDYFDADGNVFAFRGRLDGVFKRNGEKVVPEMIEAAVESHAAVERCLVSPERGLDGELVPVARITLRRGASPDVDAVMRYAKEKLPPVMVPVKVIVVDALATTSNGKLLRGTP